MKFLEHIRRKEGLETLTLTGRADSKGNRNNLAKDVKWIVKRGSEKKENI